MEGQGSRKGKGQRMVAARFFQASGAAAGSVCGGGAARHYYGRTWRGRGRWERDVFCLHHCITWCGGVAGLVYVLGGWVFMLEEACLKGYDASPACAVHGQRNSMV